MYVVRPLTQTYLQSSKDHYTMASSLLAGNIKSEPPTKSHLRNTHLPKRNSFQRKQWIAVGLNAPHKLTGTQSHGPERKMF